MLRRRAANSKQHSKHLQQKIAKLRRAEILQKSEALFHAVVDHLDVGILVIDLRSRVLHANHCMSALVGCAQENMLGKPAHHFLPQTEGWPLLRCCNSSNNSIGERASEWHQVQLKRLYRRDGRLFWAEVSAVPLRDVSGQVMGTLVTVSDISKYKWAEEHLHLLDQTIEHANDMVLLLKAESLHDSTNFRIIYTNAAFTRMTGYSATDVLGQTLKFLQGPGTDSTALDQVYAGLSKHQPVQVEMIHYAKDGSEFWADVHAVPIINEQNWLTHVVAIMRETTERKQAEEQLLRHAYHDSLTGLPNRTLFMERLGWAIAHTRQHSNYLFAVLFLDLDRFKVINDSLGHMAGDQLLQEIAGRLKRCLRPKDTVARLGGDEFTILLEDMQDVYDATIVAERIHRELTLPFNLDGHEVFTSASIGIALSKGHLTHQTYDRSEDLLRDADIAMYHAKTSGRACHQIFNIDMRIRAVELLQLENDLRRAIERQEFQLHYQPIVSLDTGRIAGFEALVRWQHPKRGQVSPRDFIATTEETGLITTLGQWVLFEACQQMKIWQDRFTTYPLLSISVNLSSKQLAQPDLIEQIQQVLKATGLDASSLKLEITESMIMENAEAATALLEKLRSRNIQLCIDDFGTGYSSLSYLRRFPINTLKIDRSFISKMHTDEENLEIVKTIVHLAHNLGIYITAEGVEQEEQLVHLWSLQCEYGQGFYFSKPLDTEAATALIASAPQW